MMYKRYIPLLLLLVLCSAPVRSQDSFTSSFNQGVTHFNNGNFDEALKLWTGLYDAGYRSANLNYNIGNAYFKLSRIPEAIIFYERAYLLDPADEDIFYNLQIARTMTVDRFQEIPELFFVKWFNLASLVLSTKTWAKISIISFVLFLLSVSLYIYSPVIKYKITGFWVALLLIIMSLGSLSFSYRNKTLVYNSHKGIITVPVLNGKSSPDVDGKDLFVLHEGTKVSIEDNIGEWYEIRLSDGNKGWVPGNTLVII